MDNQLFINKKWTTYVQFFGYRCSVKSFLAAFFVLIKIIFLAEYYAQKYGHHLRFPNAPLAEVIADKGVPLPVSSKDKQSRTIYFPLEILRICDNQRVKNQSPEMISQMIKACAVPPNQNWRNIVKARNSWQFEKCKMLGGFQTTVTKAPMTVCTVFKLLNYFIF